MIAVLWIVAALSVMVSGMLHAIRGEVAVATHVRSAVAADAVADAAIRLTLQEILNARVTSQKAIQRRNFPLFGKQVTVDTVPITGSIDLNNASLALLADTFEFAASVERQRAQLLAASVIEARERKNDQGVALKLHAKEDLLRLPGVTYDIYAKLKDCITVDLAGNGRVNPLAASSQTLAILAKGDVAAARQMAASLQIAAENIDITKLTANYIDMAPTSFLTIRAIVKIDADTDWVKDWRVDLASPSHGLPWRTLGIDRIAVVSRAVQ